MICPACEGKNRDEARFCTFCGSTLALRCAVCDTEIVPGGRFCDSCGTSVGDAAIATEPVAAARKVVTVLFADLTGSTALEENMDAESVRSVLDRFYASMRIEVERHGGRLVKFTGDGVMAAFGVPEVREDDATRAIDAAVAMRAECEQLDAILQLGLALKIGVNTGEVVVSETDDDVVGDAVNVASRLEGAASSGEILVGEETWRLTRATSRFEAVEPLVLKGKSEPVPAYRLESVEAAVDTAAPFVGRDRELESLIAVFDDAVAANAARLVTIIGSPGLGKTRLARELMSALEGRARVRETRCDPAGSATLAPIAEALRGAASIPDDAGEADVITALEALIPADDEDRERIAARAGAILGAGQPGSTEETFWALRRLIETAAQVSPVVLVLDDLHWAEPMLLDLIEHLAEWIHDAPVLLVGTGRPELRELRPSLVEGGRAAAVIALEGLDDDATERLAVELLGTEEVPAELLARIPTSTEGNPLFVRELVRMLIDDGVLRRDGDGWTVTVEVEAIQVPPTIQSLLAARVDRLASDERAVVELASVIGKEFYKGALRELAPASVREQLDTCLESLRRKELVEPVGTYWIDEPVYRFHHVLIRDAAYRRLLKESRAEIHERVAEWLQRKTADVLGEHEELIGYHLEQAHEYERQLGHADEDLGRRASALLGIAARRALDRDDLPAAAAVSGRSLARLPAEDAERSEMLLVRCEALLSMGDVGAGAVAVAELERLASTPRLVAWATCFSGQLANLRSPERLQETERSVAEAASVLAGLDDQVGAAKAHNVHASTLAGLGRFAECEAALDEALTAARAAGDNRRITATLGSAPPAALWGPNPVSRAGGRCLDIVRLLRITTGSPAVEATSLRCQAVLEAFRGRADAARRMLRSARRTLNELGLQHELLEAEQFAGIVELVAGDAAAAETHLRAAHEGFRKVGVDVLAAQSAALLARAHLALGEELEAEAFVGTSEQLGSQDLKTAIAWRSVRAEILARRGEFDEARRLAQAAVELAERTDALIDHGNACRSLATVCAAAGDAAAARSANERALALFERKGATALIDVVPAEPAKPPPASRSATTGPPPNAASRTAVQIRDRYVERDWGGLAALLEEDIVYEDRRRVLRQELVAGRDALVETFKGMAAVGVVGLPSTVHATRGERLALLRGSFTGATFESEGVFLRELSERGLGSHHILFDPDDIGAAMAELDERFIAGEGAPHADVIRGYARHSRAVNDRDWDALRDAVSDDIVVVDHRPASLGEIHGSDAWVDAIKTLAGIFEFRHDAVAFHRIDGPRFVVQAETKGRTNDGADVELAFFVVVVLDGDRIARWEFFPIEELDAAVARFDALGPAQATELADNRCARTAREFYRRVSEGDADAASALNADAMVLDDRRSGLRSVLRKSEAIENLRIAAEGNPQIDVRVLATRGERLALVETIWHAGRSRSYEIEIPAVFEIDEDGLFSNIVNFDPESFDAAMAELDDRYCAGEGAADPTMIGIYREFGRAYTARVIDGLRALIADEFVLVDHRPASTGRMDKDGSVEWMQSAFDLTEEARVFISCVHALVPRRCLLRVDLQGTTLEGVAYDGTLLLLFERTNDVLARAEQFTPNQIASALARFDELTRDDIPRAAGPSNQASRQTERAVEHVNRGEFDALAALHAGGVRLDDRRHGLGSTLIGRDAMADQARATVGVGASDIRYECVAIRGQRLALGRVLYASDDPDITFEVEILQLIEIDPAGLIIAVDIWDADEATAAFAELTERFLAGEGAAHADIVRCEARRVEALNRRDWDGLRDVFTDDFVLVDHRPVALGTIHGADGWIDSIRKLADLVAFRSDVVAYHAMDGDRFVSHTVNHGKTADGGSVELPFLTVGVVRDGRMARWELLPLEGRAEAFARFEELGAGDAAAVRAPENQASRQATLSYRHLQLHEFDAQASLESTDVVAHDWQGLRSTIVGRDALARAAKVIADLGVDDARFECVAVRGERLALGKGFLGSKDPAVVFGVEFLTLGEIGADGLFVSWDTWDVDDLDAAIAHLDERYLRGEGATHAGVLDMTSRLLQAANARAWDDYRALLADDLRYVNHRRVARAATSTANEYLSATIALYQLVPELRAYVVAYEAIASDRAVVRVLGRGVNEEGGEFEIETYIVGMYTDDRVTVWEVFDIDQRDAALARFDELGAAESHETLAVRTMREHDACVVRGDWERLRSLHDTDVSWTDTRQGLGSTVHGVDARIAGLELVAELGVARIEQDIVATRGERLVLSRVTFGAKESDSFETVALRLCEVDEQGRITAGFRFDTADEDAAFAMLDERFLHGEGATCAEAVRRNAETIAIINDRDWAAYAARATDDFVMVDHRPASLGQLDIEGSIKAHRKLIELIPDLHLRVRNYQAIDNDRWLAEIAAFGRTRDGDPLDLSFFTVGQLRGGKLARREFFPIDRLDDALARFTELGQTDRRQDNLAIRTLRAHNECLMRRDWERLRSLHTDDVTWTDVRAGLRSTTRGVDERIADLKASAGVGVRAIDEHIVATRGDRLVLSKLVFSSGGESFDTEILSVVEVDERGRITAGFRFQPSDLDGAFEALDERYAAGEAAEFADLVRFAANATTAWNARDWDRYEASMAPDVVFVDHRPAGAGVVRGREHMVALAKGMTDLVPDLRHDTVAIHALGRHGMVSGYLARGTNADGGVVELAYVNVAVIRDGVVVHYERFAVDQLDEALTRFEELASMSPTSKRVLWNLATTAIERTADAVTAQDWTAYAELLADDSVWDDRRPGLRSVLSGKNLRLENARAIGSIGVRRTPHEFIAIRGDRLALARVTVDAGDDSSFTSDVLYLGEVDDEGRISASVVFAPDDLDAAYKELNHRYIAGEGAPYAAMLPFHFAFSSTVNRRDWDAFRHLLADDLIRVDHRPISVGNADVEGWIDAIRALVDVIPDLQAATTSFHGLTTDSWWAQVYIWGSGQDGGLVDFSYQSVGQVRDERIVRWEVFDDSQSADAKALFERLTQELDEHWAPENAASRASVELSGYIRRSDWDSFAARSAHDIRVEDRRSGLRWVGVGREQLRERAEAFTSVGHTGLKEIRLASWGDKLCLTRQTWGDAESWASERLVLREIDEDGKLASTVIFEPGDLAEALRELSERYIAGEGRDHAEVIRLQMRAAHAHRERDWDAFEALHDDDVVVVDHRPAGAGTFSGGDANIHYMRTLVDLAPDAQIVPTEVIATARDRALSRLRVVGSTPDGSHVELAGLVLCVMRDGRLSRIEQFPVDALNAALARFDELGAVLPAAPFENSAFRTMQRWRDALERADFDLLTELLSEDSVIDDRRAGLHDFCDGREACIANLRATFEVGTRHIASTPIAVRGDRLVLQRWTFGGREYGSTAFASEMLVVNEIDESGRHAAGVLFDVADMDAAFAELDARYIAGEGAACADAVRAEATLCQTLNRRDWDAFHALFADDFVLVDHRPASLGTLDADGWLTAQKAKIEIVPTYRGDPIYYHGLAPGRWWVQVLARATTDYDTDVDFSVQSVGQVRDGRIVRLDTFLDSQTAEAQALFEALGPADSTAGVLENECTRHRARWDGLFAARLDAQRQMIAEDAVSEDRRAGLRSRVVGREPFLQALEVVRELGPALDVDVVAIRGERLALFRMRWRDPSAASDGFAVEVLQLHALDDSGLLVSVIVFDPDRIDAPVDELDERFLASDEATDAARAATETNRAYNARDWARFRQTMSDGFVFVDHHPASRGTIRGVDAVVVHAKGLIDLVPDIRMVTRAFLGSESDVSLRSLWLFGTDVNGSRVEFEYLNLSVARDGLGTRLEIFPPERRDDALARFEELRDAPAS